MVGRDLGQDVLSFGCPVLVIGDPAQLPPVKSAGFFVGEPDATLTEIHRQAKDDPIIWLSMIVREGGTLDYGHYGESSVIHRSQLTPEEAVGADQLLVGRNVTRWAKNARSREILGFPGLLPCQGEKLVCLRNDHDKGLLNGTTWIVQAPGILKNGFSERCLFLEVKPDGEPDAETVKICCRPEAFENPAEEEKPDDNYPKDFDAFSFGYALTVHKSQGSQWNHVVLLNESGAFRGHAKRWLYTGITRAAEKLTIAQ
jgi:exodeoxyribonuclease-5